MDETRMARRRLIFEGRAKSLYEGPEPGAIVMHFKDGPGGDGDDDQGVATIGTVMGKGVLNNRISEFLMTRLQECGVPTHFVRRLNMREQIVRDVEILPVGVVVRNIAAGSFSERFGIEEGTPLPRSIVEYYWKNREKGEPLVSEEHITAFGWATPQDIDDILALTLRANDYLSGLFYGAGLRLIDIRFEFGRLFEESGEMRIVLADELSPDCCRLWDIETNEKMDKDRLRHDIDGAEKAYQEVARRLGVLPESAPSEPDGATQIH
jgi:phosphoribosylaminoimidazole-succinocarboxamide synthase